MAEPAKKAYVLDTNVLVHDPLALYAFGQSMVAIPVMVLEELDQFKSENSDRGRNARDSIRRLDTLRERGALNQGVTLDNGGELRIIIAPAKELDEFIAGRFGDKGILAAAAYLKKQGYDVRFISKDINARVKADVLGIQAEDYLKDRVRPEEFYKGWMREAVSANDLKKEYPVILRDIVAERHLYVNQFVWLYNQHNECNYRLFRYQGGEQFTQVYMPELVWPLQPRNSEQLMAMDLLMDPEIQLITLLGPAGTGKTLLSLLAGLHQVLIRDLYRKLLIARPVVPLGPDIGYLPGDIHEKLHSWMQPIYDNMELITHDSLGGSAQPKYDHLRTVACEARRRPREGSRSKDRAKAHKYMLRPLDRMIREEKISLEAITYMRGRSIPYQYIFIDEVQNLSPHEVKTIITRVGEGSKIVLSGDPYQIDSPYLDFSSNGLVVVSNAFKGQKIAGTVYLDITERSELSRIAGELL
jgi:PhoH-like ATPase